MNNKQEYKYLYKQAYKQGINLPEHYYVLCILHFFVCWFVSLFKNPYFIFVKQKYVFHGKQNTLFWKTIVLFGVNSPRFVPHHFFNVLASTVLLTHAEVI